MCYGSLESNAHCDFAPEGFDAVVCLKVFNGEHNKVRNSMKNNSQVNEIKGVHCYVMHNNAIIRNKHFYALNAPARASIRSVNQLFTEKDGTRKRCN